MAAAVKMIDLREMTVEMRTDAYTECRGVGHIAGNHSAAGRSGQVGQQRKSDGVLGLMPKPTRDSPLFMLAPSSSVLAASSSVLNPSCFVLPMRSSSSVYLSAFPTTPNHERQAYCATSSLPPTPDTKA